MAKLRKKENVTTEIWDEFLDVPGQKQINFLDFFENEYSFKDLTNLMLDIQQALPNHYNFRFSGYCSLIADRPETEEEKVKRLKWQKDNAARLKKQRIAREKAKKLKELSDRQRKIKMYEDLKKELYGNGKKQK
jgi:hypothetical protein